MTFRRGIFVRGQEQTLKRFQSSSSHGIEAAGLLQRNPAIAYGVAAAIGVIAIILRVVLAAYLTIAPFITFFPAVVLTAYVAGRNAGLLTAGLCGAAGWYLFVPPLRSFRIESTSEAVAIIVYFVTALAIAWLVGGWRSTKQREGALVGELRASEEQFRFLADSSPALIWVTDEKAQVTFANRRYEEVFGKPADAIEGEGWRSIVHPDDVETFNALFLTALTKRERFVGEVRVQDGTGKIMWLHCEGVPRFGPDGTFLGYVGANLDISQAKLAEERLRELNESLEQRIADAVAEQRLLADLVENTDAFVQVADLDYRWLAINKAAADEFERIYGVRPKVGDSMLELLAPWPEHQLAVHNVWSRALGGEAFTDVGEFGEADRERRSYEMKYHVLRDAAGNRIGAYQFVYDVTERVREQERLLEAESARRETDALYRTYFENSPEALFVIGVDPDGGFVVEQVNPAHEVGVGFKAEQVVGQRIENILPPEAAAKVLEIYRHVAETRAIYQFREVFDLGESPQHWDTSLVPMVGHDGRVIRLIGSSRNMTAQVAAEEALRQSQKMEAMGQLTGGVAHDFNNLLTPIVGALDMLQRKGDGGEREQRLIMGAAQSADRAKTLVQRLLAFARRQPLQPVAVDLPNLVTDMASLISSTTGPQIKVVVDAGQDLPSAKADPNQLEMAVLNLAVNARDAMPEGGTLRISVEAATVGRQHRSRLEPGPYLLLSVADTGSGMDEATQARAVEPFFSTKGVGKGTGLGLSMVHGLALQLGGAVTIRSTVGVGTNVELWLPQSRDASAAVRPSEAAYAELIARGTVLLVDDEDAVRLSTADMLNELGYDVVEASSAEEALRLLNRGLHPQLLVTDHLMPGMSGTELARVVQSQRQGLQVLIISGYAEDEGVAVDLPRLAKPFRNAELAACLAAMHVSAEVPKVSLGTST